MDIQPKKKSNVEFNKKNELYHKNDLSKEFNYRYEKILNDYNALMDEVYWNELIYDKNICEMNFQPTINNKYYLYKRNNEKYFLYDLSKKTTTSSVS